MNTTIRKAALVFDKEFRVMRRDRRLVIGVTVTSLVVMPALMGLLGSLDRLRDASGKPVRIVVDTADDVLREAVGRIEDPVTIGTGATESDADIQVIHQGPRYLIVAYRTAPRSWQIAQRLETAVRAVHRRIVADTLAARGIPADLIRPFTVTVIDAADPAARGAILLATLVPYLVIVLLVANAIRALYVAVGEKEHRTLASLLVCAVPRGSIVLGKTLAILTFAIVSSALLIAGMLLFGRLGFFPGQGPADISFRLAPVQVIQLFVTIGALGLAVSAIIMVLGTYARSRREAGVYTSPVLFLSIFLAIFSFSTSAFSLPVYAVPFLGTALSVRDVILGTPAWTGVAVSAGANLTLFVLLTTVTVGMYHRETVLFRR